jgi:endogenous inhibitor of DNA gyrase (YacG/DUF329 family)
MSAPSPEPRKCSLCGKPQDPKYRPFCSRHCADIDLGRWLNEEYSIPVETIPDTDGEGD